MSLLGKNHVHFVWLGGMGSKQLGKVNIHVHINHQECFSFLEIFDELKNTTFITCFFLNKLGVVVDFNKFQLRKLSK